MKKIVFYYHHFGGYGHGMRVYSLCKALQSVDKYKILVINSGVEQPELNIEHYAKVYNLPPVVAAESLFTGLSSKDDVQRVLAKRQALLQKIVVKFDPDMAIIEHFPFGRMSLEDEIVDFISDLRRKNCLVYSSVRDLILFKGKKDHFKLFNGILIHEDPKFGLCLAAPDNSFFTGRVHPYDKFSPEDRVHFREILQIGSKKLIIASIGGGLDGHELLEKLIIIKEKVSEKYPCRFLVYTGSSFPNEQYKALAQNLPQDFQILRFDSKLMEHVHAADLFISMGGYNSINSHLLSDTPSMIFPRLSDKEQQARAERFGFKCYDYKMISSSELSAEIEDKLVQGTEKSKKVDMNGAQKSARFLTTALTIKRAKIRLTTKCDLNCAMCSWKKRNEELEEEKIYEVLDDLAMLSVQTVNFTGGEPTMFSKLFPILKYAKNRGLRVSLSTNGFNQQVLSRIGSYLDFVDISIDSALEPLNDSIRGKKGAYASAIRSVGYFFAKGIKPHINVTVRPDNYKGLHRLVADLQDQISSISFTLVDTAVNQRKEMIFSCDDLMTYYFNEVFLILKEADKYSIPVRLTPYFEDLKGLPSQDILSKMLHHKEEYSGRFREIFTLRGKDCQAATEQIRINSNGLVSPCCYLDDGPVFWGNINSLSLKEIVVDDIYFYHTRQAQEGMGSCLACQQGYAMYKELCF